MSIVSVNSFDTENAVLGQIVCGVQIGCNCGCGTS